MVVGENGILNRAQDASEKTKFASEKEAIEFIMNDIKTGLMINEDIPNEKYIGDKLSEMSAITGDWKNVIVGENTYKDGWYLVEKGEEIEGYGEAKLNWLLNYNTGEMIELKDGEYTIANANASGAIVDTSLKLNIDPVNLQDPSKWGTGVRFIDRDGSGNSGVKATEIKFDGKDDYLKIENVTVEKSEGFTFEFYGKTYDDKRIILAKTMFDEDGNSKEALTDFRINGEFSKLRMRLGSCDNQSDLSEGLIYDGSNAEWLRFSNIDINPEQDTYFSFSVNFEKNEIKAYQDGALKQSTICSQDYFESGTVLFDKSVPFTLGMMVQAPMGVYGEDYSQLNLYACRLYTRILSDTEIENNYTATKSYHDELVKP